MKNILLLILMTFFLSLKEKDDVNRVYCKNKKFVNENINNADTSYYIWPRDLKDGKWEVYYDKGLTKKCLEAEIKGGAFLGEEKYWRKNGTLKYKHLYNQVSDTSISYNYYENGILKDYSIRYRNMLVESAKSFYESGKLESERSKNKKVDYYENGNVMSMCFGKENLYYSYGNFITLTFDSIGNYQGTYKTFVDTLSFPSETYPGEYILKIVVNEVNIDSLKR